MIRNLNKILLKIGFIYRWVYAAEIKKERERLEALAKRNKLIAGIEAKAIILTRLAGAPKLREAKKKRETRAKKKKSDDYLRVSQGLIIDKSAFETDTETCDSILISTFISEHGSGIDSMPLYKYDSPIIQTH